MKYLCMGYHSEKQFAALPEQQRSALMQDSQAYVGELKQKGHWLHDSMLQGVNTAATLRSDNGKIVVTDGPFAETKEQLGGVCLLEANDLNHAIQLMSKMPCMRVGGSMEIRPIHENV